MSEIEEKIKEKYKFHSNPEGPRDAKVAVVAEKFGRDEHYNLVFKNENRPLIGASGRELNLFLKNVGLSREEVYLTNSIRLYNTVIFQGQEKIETPTTAEIIEQMPFLWEELCSLPNLKVIIALGEVALNALSAFQYQGITKWRGSILETGFSKIMIPTFHPAYYMRGMWEFRPLVQFDINRAAQLSKLPAYIPKQRRLYIKPSFEEAITWFEILEKSRELAYDIELSKGIITCISFSDHPDRSFCFPFFHNDRSPYWPPDKHAEILNRIQRLFNSPTRKYIAQNGLFDSWHLWRHGIQIMYNGKNGFDTLYGHRVLMPGMPHDLGFLVSIYTKEPYYKDESGDWKSAIKVPEEQFWGYNCKDSACTLEAAALIKKDMIETKTYDYYITHVQPQFEIFLQMQQLGVRINTPLLSEMRLDLMRRISAAEKELEESLGWIPNVRSKIDIKKAFDQLGIAYRKTEKGLAKSDVKALNAYALKYPNARKTIIAFKEISDLRTDLSNFLSMRLDEKYFYHPRLSLFATKQGRASSQGDELGGPQIQNWPKNIRKLVIPDTPEHELTQADLKQAEKMYVAWDSQDPLLMEAFRLGKDTHNVLGCVLYRGWNDITLPPDNLLDSIKRVCEDCKSRGESECSHSERHYSKISGYGFMYMQGVNRFLLEQSKYNIFISLKEAERMRNLTLSKWIIDWHNRTRFEMRKSPWFENPLGLRREFYGRPDDEMLREILSWKASSTVSSIVSIATIRTYKNLPPSSRILTQTHDSLLICHLKKDKEQIDSILKEAFDVPMTINGRELIIPIDITHGPSWGEQKK